MKRSVFVHFALLVETPRADEDPGLKHAVAELRSRLEYLNEVGLGSSEDYKALTENPFVLGEAPVPLFYGASEGFTFLPNFFGMK